MQRREVKTIDALVKNESVLKTVRNLLFPAIKTHLVTGYNLYSDIPISSYAHPTLDYYHSDLDPQDTHYQELDYILRRESLLEAHPHLTVKRVPRRTLQRYATYRHLPHWKKERGMRVFTLEGEELSLEDALLLNKHCIIEQRQYKLRLFTHTPDELRFAINLFKKYASIFRLDAYGKRIPISPGSRRFKTNINQNGEKRYFRGSWEVPLLTFLACGKPKGFRDFLQANLFSIDMKGLDILVEIIARSKKKELKSFLEARNVPYVTEPLFVLRTFLEDYMEKKTR